MKEDLLIGSLISERYRVRALLGAGGMGRVYRAHHELMRKDVALKVLHRDHLSVPEIVERFEREALATAHINHPHVAGATDFGQLEDGSYYLVLELIEGRALCEIIAQDGALLPGRALNLGYQIATALEAAHAQGIIHRDLKPENIMVKQSGQGEFAKVTDFGIARVPTHGPEKGKTLTQAGMVYGTPEYMAPEQALGQVVDERADLFALGMVLYEMLSGQRPYSGPVTTLLGQQLSQPLPSLEAKGLKSALSKRARILITQLLDKEASKRPSSVQWVVQELLAATREQLSLDDRKPSLVHKMKERLLSHQAAPRPSASNQEARGLLKTEAQPLRVQSSPRLRTEQKGRASPLRWQTISLMALAGIFGVAFAIMFTEKIFAFKEASPVVLKIEEEPPQLPEKLRLAKLDGLAGLEALAAEYPEAPQVVAQLAKQLVVAGKFKQGVDEARHALELDPALNREPALRGALFRAAQTQQAGYEAQRLLHSAMGASGIDVLYDLAHMQQVNISTRQRVKDLLKKPGIIAHASPALRATLELEQARACPQVASKLEIVSRVGDRRATRRLGELKQQLDCASNQRCLSCLGGLKNIEEAEQQLRAWP